MACVQPYAATEGVAVYVVSDWFHSGVIIEEGDGPDYTYTFYTFGDRAWYQEGTRGFRAGFQAVLRGSDAVVAKGVVTTDAGIQSIIDGVRLEGRPNGWLFVIPRTELDEALDYLNADVIRNPDTPIARESSGGFEYSFYDARRPYHVFNSCVQFTAGFLARAGLDFEPVWYFYTNAILRDRLNRLTEMVF